MELPNIDQDEFTTELLSETLQKNAMLEQQNLHLRMQVKKIEEMQEAAANEEEPELEIVSD